MKTVAILGARGRLGRVVARAFATHGWRVIAVTRDGKVPTDLHGIETRAADAMDRQALVDACRGADVIFNGLNPVYTEWSTCAPVLAENVIAAVRATKALHLFAGNIYNYGPEMPPVIDETTPMPGGTRKGDIRNAMEKRFRDAVDMGVKTIVVRAGDFYGGRGTGSWFDLAITARLDKGVFAWPGGSRAADMEIEHAWAYLPDLAEVFVRMAARGCADSGFETYTFAGHTLSGEAMKQHVEHALNRKLKTVGMPWWLIKGGSRFVPMWRELAEIAYLWRRPHRLSGDALEAAIGPLPATEPAAAVARALSDLGRLSSRRAAA